MQNLIHKYLKIALYGFVLCTTAILALLSISGSSGQAGTDHRAAVIGILGQEVHADAPTDGDNDGDNDDGDNDDGDSGRDSDGDDSDAS
jgi:hypothetical protein